MRIDWVLMWTELHSYFRRGFEFLDSREPRRASAPLCPRPSGEMGTVKKLKSNSISAPLSPTWERGRGVRGRISL